MNLIGNSRSFLFSFNNISYDEQIRTGRGFANPENNHYSLEQSIQNLCDLQSEFDEFCKMPRTNAKILENEEGLFRPILLAERFDMDLLHSICERWRILISQELKMLTRGMN